MFKVQCPDCEAPYQVDERRIPPSGIRMRCPKCGGSFQVAQPQQGGSSTPPAFSSIPAPVLGRAAAQPLEPRAERVSHRATMVGVGTSGAPPEPTADLPMPREPRANTGTAPLSAKQGRPKPPPPKGRAKPPAAVRFPSAAGIEDEAAEPAEIDDAEAIDELPLEELGEVDLDLPSLGQRMHGRPAAAETHQGDELDLPAPVPVVRSATAPVREGGVMVARPPRPTPEKPQGAGPRRAAETGLPVSGSAERSAMDVPGTGSSRGAGIDLPAPVRQPTGAKAVPVGSAPLASLDLELDLPSVGTTGGGSPGRGPDELDLPSPGERTSDYPELDLPSPGDALAFDEKDDEFELPSPVRDQLPVLSAGLPSIKPAELPEPAAVLPGVVTAASGGAREQGHPSSPPESLPMAERASSHPLGGGDLESGAEEWREGFGEVNLGGSVEDGGTELGFETSSRAPASGDHPEVQRAAGGGTSFGEVNLGDAGEGDSSVDLRSAVPEAPPAQDEDMEFGAIPQESAQSSGDQVIGGAVPGTDAKQPLVSDQERARRRRKRVLWIGAAVSVLVVGGASLALSPELGPYGVHFISDAIHQDEYHRTASARIGQSRAAMAEDTYGTYRTAMRSLETAMAKHERLRPLVSYAAFLGQLAQLRFGSDPPQKARADVRLSSLSEGQEDSYLDLARAARAAADGELAKARQSLKRVGAREESRLDGVILAGEVELAVGNGEAALRYWNQAEALEKSPRTAFGAARAHALAGNLAAAREKALSALKRNPEHAGARIILARTLWHLDQDVSGARELVDAVIKNAIQASPIELVDAYTLLGDTHLETSHISAAEAAYGHALKIVPQAARALSGLGDTLYRAGRYSESLARFEAAAQADPNDLAAAVGVAKSNIALEKLREASATLKKLREAHPKSALVHYWYGQAEEALGNRDEAEKAFQQAIAHGAGGDIVVRAYVALALLMNQLGRREEAQTLLTTAREKLGESAEVHKALGQLAMSQGRYGEALTRFRDAARLNPRDLATKFNLGASLSRLREFEEATKVFDEVAEVDRDFPGLALERGLLYESSGRSDEALKMYESALDKAPDDPDLMLRVGCGKVAAGRYQQALGLLEKVLTQKPQSAETSHCLGRARLIEGKNLAEALRTLKRAVELDPHRPEYHLYVGWAANEAGRVAEAEEALKRALELDQGLADAFWQRGVLRYRQGAVKDAVQDLKRALELRPSRSEARAALADAYYDLGREGQALEQWRLAIEAQPENATWHYRYGRLLAQNRLNAEARGELERALQLAESEEPRARWLWEAHRLLARAIGHQSAAIEHWEHFLRMSPQDNAYRDEAKKELKQLGKPWDGI